MPVSKQTLDPFIELLEAVQQSFSAYDLQNKAGVACAKGTLTARLNNLKIISVALEAQESTKKDLNELNQFGSTLAWLHQDKDVLKDFVGETLQIAETALARSHDTIVLAGEMTYVEAIAIAQRALQEIVLAD